MLQLGQDFCLKMFGVKQRGGHLDEDLRLYHVGLLWKDSQRQRGSNIVSVVNHCR